MKMLHKDHVKIFAKICLLTVCFYLGAEYWLWEWAALLISSLYALQMPKRKAFFVIFISYFMGCFNEQYILPVIIYWKIVGIEAAVFSISMILLPAIRGKCPPGVALFTFSSIFVLGEYLISLYSPHGTIGSIAYTQTEYEKKYKPGYENVIWDQNKALAICKDMDFTKPAAIYSKNGAGIMFVPALDVHDDAKAHKRIAIMRGIEGGYAVVGACLAEVIVVLLKIYRGRRKFLSAESR